MAATPISFSASDVGTLPGTYQTVFAAMYQHILSDREIAGRGHRALCGPTASVPVLPMLETKTLWQSLTLFDPRPEHTTFQSKRVKDLDRVDVTCSNLSALAELGSTFDIIFDPLGLQETPNEWNVNISAVHRMLAPGGIFVTASWGETTYPTEVENLPGIIQDKTFSNNNLTPRLMENSFTLEHEHEVKFAVEHTRDQMLALIATEHVSDRDLNDIITQNAYSIGSKVYIRKYKSIS